jgi:hypothetical protein
MKANNRTLMNILGRFASEGLKDLSDNEIEQTLIRCVAGKKLITIAKYNRDNGIFVFTDGRAQLSN